MRYLHLTKALLLLTLYYSTPTSCMGYSFQDPTKKSGSQQRSGLSSINKQFTNRRNLNNNSSGGSGGMPVSKFGAKKTPNPMNQTGSQNPNNSNNMQQIMQLLQSNPQMMSTFQNAMGSGNSQQKSALLTTLLTLIGGGNNNNNNNNNMGQQIQKPGRPDLPTHCSTPKYHTIMNAVKGVSMNKEKALAHNSQEKVSFVYYKKTEEANFLLYKLVFKYKKNSRDSFVYSEFSIPKISGHHLKFQNYLITSNKNLLQSIVNETDFSYNNTIPCMDLKIMFNGGIAGQAPASTSAFAGNPGNMGMNPQMMGNGMMGNNMMGNNMMGNNMMGNNMMGNNMMGNNMRQGFGYQAQPQVSGGFGYQGQNQQRGGFGYNPQMQSQTGGTFLTGK